MDQILRDAHGKKLGTIKQENGKEVIRNANGKKLGSYDANNNTTRDANGRKIGTGNILTSLL